MTGKAQKHFNSGNIFGKVLEYEKKTSAGDKDFISLKVNVSGARSGSVHAYCRIWGAEACTAFLLEHRTNPNTAFYLKGFYGQYRNERNEWLSNFTIFHWEARDQVEPRAVFILRGVVDIAAPTTDGGQRLILKVQRTDNPEEVFELWCAGEQLLDEVHSGDFLEVKGYVRQAETEDEFGGSSGPIRAYVHGLRAL
jgi:hypothetical protein